LNKKISLGTVIGLIAIAVAITSAITMNAVKLSYNSILKNLPERSQRYALLEELQDIIDWCIDVELPVTFQQLGLENVTDAQLMAVAEAACAEGDTLGNMPIIITPEKVVAAMKAAGAYGRYSLGL
jgi:glycerol dehydrogenase-like iron-containing ADH family enzyme